MSRYFRYGVTLQNHVRIFTTGRFSGCIYSCRQSYSEKITSLLPQVCSFSVKSPRVRADPHVDEEKFSDSDSDTEPDYVLDSIMKVGKPLTSLEWENVKTEACSKKQGFNLYNIDAVVMTFCNRYKQLDIGLSYIEHLFQIGKQLNIATIAHFMRLCYNCYSEKVSEQLILSLYDDLHKRFPVLDATTCESVILGLCLTSRWEESIQFFDMIKLTCSPGGLEYSALIKKAFDNNKGTIGTNYLEEMLQYVRVPRPEVYLSWLDYLDRLSGKNSQKRWKMIEGTVLPFFVENDIKPTVDIVEKLRQWHQEVGSGYHSEFTSLTASGVCKSCQKFLQPIKITAQEFEDLRSAFLEKVVVGKDVFTKTTPEELEKFKKFVKNTAPYDIVLDGLNIAYGIGKKSGPKNYALTLEQVVKHFHAKSQKVLVLGRDHMKSWPKQHMNNVYKYASVFLAQDMSQDDPFLLYATLYSGQGTSFLSRDLMRSHSFLLKNKTLRSIFKRWQLQRQYRLQYITKGGEVHIQHPVTFNPSIQMGDDGSWHIPYDAEFSVDPPEIFELPTLWLCLTSMKKQRREIEQLNKFRKS